MVTVILSSKQPDGDLLKKLVSKQLDSVNNLQIAVGKNGELLVYPTDYPDSIVGVLRALSIADSAVFVVNESISALDAELALAIEYSGIGNGTVLYSDYSDMNSFKSLFSKQKVGSFPHLKDSAARPEPPAIAQGEASAVSIDKHFTVKGIGSVIIGFVASGSIKKGDRMYLLPSGKQVTVKSIQLMDVDVQEAKKGDHVGLALNNAAEDDLSANYCVSSSNEVSDEFGARIEFSQFYDKENAFTRSLSCALLGNNFTVTLSASLDRITAKLNRKSPMVPGRHVLADASRVVGRSRIVGSVEFV